MGARKSGEGEGGDGEKIGKRGGIEREGMGVGEAGEGGGEARRGAWDKEGGVNGGEWGGRGGDQEPVRLSVHKPEKTYQASHNRRTI